MSDSESDEFGSETSSDIESTLPSEYPPIYTPREHWLDIPVPEPCQLCDRCRSVPWELLFEPPANAVPDQEPTVIYEWVGTAEELRDKGEECKICRWALRDTNIFRQDYIVKLMFNIGGVNSHPVIIQIGEIDTMSDGSKRYGVVLERHFRPLICNNSLSSSSLLPWGAIPYPSPERVVPQTRRWLEDSNTLVYAVPDKFQICLPYFRVVNTTDFRVQEFTDVALHTLGYAALSYVWGRGQQLKLTHENFPRLSSTNGVKGAPRTIIEAIELTATLGIKYLWVDALCLFQDDVHVDTAHMGLIYLNSDLTIVGAAGSCSDDQLLRYPDRADPQYLDPISVLPENSHTPPLVLLGTRLAMPVEIGVSPAQSSVWATRAWTLQEMRLSRRCLFILDHCISMHFQNLDGDIIVQEEYLWPVNSFGAPYGSSLAEAATIASYIKTDIVAFNTIFSLYSRRSISFEADYFAAFGGIVEVTEKMIGWKCLWGVPKHVFFTGLLWPCHADVTQSNQIDLISKPQSWVQSAPTWSAFGWHGSHYLLYCNEDISKIQAPKIYVLRCLSHNNRRIPGELRLVPVDSIINDYEEDTSEVESNPWSIDELLRQVPSLSTLTLLRAGHNRLLVMKVETCLGFFEVDNIHERCLERNGFARYCVFRPKTDPTSIWKFSLDPHIWGGNNKYHTDEVEFLLIYSIHPSYPGRTNGYHLLVCRSRVDGVARRVGMLGRFKYGLRPLPWEDTILLLL